MSIQCPHCGYTLLESDEYDEDHDDEVQGIIKQHLPDCVYLRDPQSL